MTKVNWDTVEVFENGDIYWNGFHVEIGDCLDESESKSGLAYELRHTPDAGRHIVAFKLASDPLSYLYTVCCKQPGKYFLGPTSGYRKEDGEGSEPGA